jgi:deoxyadenosine/deoxycytidine kinase
MRKPRCRYITVMGTMGVGKSTAASLIARELGFELLAENFGDNLFLPRFYRDMKRWAFHSQTYFLMEKINQTVLTGKLLRKTPVVQDTPIIQDAFSYAQAHHIMGNIDDAEWGLYEKIYRTFEPLFPVPDLVVFLEAPVATIADRIRNRGRGYEQEVPVGYLKLLDRLNRGIIAGLKVPVLRIKTGRLNIVADESARKRFIDRIGTVLPPVPATPGSAPSAILSP